MPTNTESPNATCSHDPYRHFRFRVKWDDRYVAGVSKLRGQSHTTQTISHRSGGDPAGAPRLMPGQSEYQSIVLERGVTCDVAFQHWANKVWDYQPGAENEDVSLKDFRKDLIIESFDEAGQKVLAYKIIRCWPSEFTALPEMEGDGSVVAIQLLKLENEGWERA